MSNTIDWGKIHSLSWSPETNLTGTATSSFSNTYSTEYDGVDDYVDLGDLSAEFSGQTTASVSLWFKRDTTTNQILFDLKDGTSRIAIQLYQNTSIYFYLNNKNYVHSTVPAIDTWYNLIYVFNGGGTTNADKLKMYLNGTELTGGTYSGAIDTAIGTLTSSMTSYIGRTPSHVAYFDGNIDEVALFNTALSSSDVTSIYNSGVPASLTSYSPVGWWRFEGTGTTATDSGSGDNDGTLTNGVTRSTDVPT